MKIPIGPKHVEQARGWISSLAGFGATGSLAVLYFTDWKLVLQYVPFYGSKFEKSD